MNANHFGPGNLIFPSFAERETEKPGRTVARGKPGLVPRKLRQCLGWVPGAKGASAYTLKTYRAGRATDLPAAGFTLGDI